MARFSSSALSLEACKACSALPVDAFSRCDSALISPCSLSTCLEYLASTSAVRDFASSKSCTRVCGTGGMVTTSTHGTRHTAQYPPCRGP